MEVKREWGFIIWNGVGLPPRDDIRFIDDKEFLIEYLEKNCKDGDKVWLNYGKVIDDGNGWKEDGMTILAWDYKAVIKDLNKYLWLF